MKLNPQQKLQLLREMDKKVSLGLLSAFVFFEDTLNNLSKEKQDEFKKLMNDMNVEIKKLQFAVRDGVDGTDGEDGVDGENGKDADEQKIIEELSRRIKQPKDGKNAVVNYDFIFDYILSQIKQPKDGKDGKNGSPDKPLEIVSKLNTLEEKVDQKVIRGLKKRLEGLEISIREKKREKGGGQSGGGGDSINFHDLSSLTDGSTKVFTVPRGRKVVIFGSDFPSVLMEGNGFTMNATRTQITLTVGVAPSQGSQLLYQYTR